MTANKRSIRIQLSGGISEDVNAKLLPDGAIKALHNLYYDRQYSLMRRRGSEWFRSSAGTLPASAYYHNGEQRIVVRSGVGGAVSIVDGTTTTTKWDNLCAMGAVSKEGMREGTETGPQWSYITLAGGFVQKHQYPTNRYVQFAYRQTNTDEGQYLKANRAATTTVSIYSVSATCPDGVLTELVPVYDGVPFLMHSMGVVNTYTLNINAQPAFLVAYLYADMANAVVRTYKRVWEVTDSSPPAQTGSIEIDPPSFSGDWGPYILCSANGFGADRDRVWIANSSAVISWKAPGYGAPDEMTDLVYSGPIKAGNFASGGSPNRHLFAFVAEADHTSPEHVVVCSVSANGTDYTFSHLMGVNAVRAGIKADADSDDSTSWVMLSACRRSEDGNNRGILYGGPSAEELQPIGSYAHRTHSGGWAHGDDAARVPLVDPQPVCQYRSTTHWVDHEVSPEGLDQRDLYPYHYSANTGDWQSLQPAVCGGTVYYSGGLVQHNNGEVGFLLPPERTDITLTSYADSGTDGPARVCSYRIVYEYTTPDGLREQSAPSIAQTCAVASTQGVSIKLAPPLTRKTGCIARVYRDSQLGGQIHHEVASTVIPDGCTTWVYATDTLTDSAAAEREVLYVDQNIIESVLPPQSAHTVLWSHGGRLWCADGCRARFSTEARQYDLVQWADDNYVTCPSDVVAFATWGDTLIILCVGGVYLLPGQGPTRDGASPYGPPYHLAGAPGCSAKYGGQRSVCAFPGGIVYRSESAIEMLQGGNGLVATRLSDAVQDELSSYPVVRGVMHDANLQQIRFLLDDGISDGLESTVVNGTRVLVYEYGTSLVAERTIWHTESVDLLGIHSYTCLGDWNGAPVVGGGTNLKTQLLWTHHSDTPSCTGFSAHVELGRVRPGGESGWGRIYSVTVLADATSSPRPGIAAVNWEFDYETTSQTILNQPTASGEYACHLTSPRQKCHHVILTLAENQSADATAHVGVTWNSVTIEAAALPGQRRLASNRRY